MSSSSSNREKTEEQKSTLDANYQPHQASFCSELPQANIVEWFYYWPEQQSCHFGSDPENWSDLFSMSKAAQKQQQQEYQTMPTSPPSLPNTNNNNNKTFKEEDSNSCSINNEHNHLPLSSQQKLELDYNIQVLCYLKLTKFYN